MKIEICKRCGKEYFPTTHGIQKYCKECSSIVDKEREKQWHLNHPEYDKQRYLENCEQMKQRNEQWRLEHPKRTRELERRHENKRERNLGFIPLNDYFEGSEAHHLDKNYVIYIPEEVHHSIYHSILRDINMDEINAVAFNYLNYKSS
ncbi:MAG: hypothetical protein NTZ83_00005 [Candidatus Pacearchaeota archaeon]|nr:hypothetical protein [Candidatus Pacearchaeota archaeon]